MYHNQGAQYVPVVNPGHMSESMFWADQVIFLVYLRLRQIVESPVNFDRWECHKHTIIQRDCWVEVATVRQY